MIAFVTALRARALANDWEHHVWLLERTITSMLAQSHGECHVVVACHDMPKTSFACDPRVEFLEVKFPVPERHFDDMCVDKVLKLSAGIESALAHGCAYVVFVDADDLVSNRLAGFVADHSGAPGWYAASTMFYSYGSRLLRAFDFHAPAVPPFVIVRSDLLTFAAPPFSDSWRNLVLAGGESGYLEMLGRHGQRVNVLAAVGLGNYREFMKNEGNSLNQLPFSAIVMINHTGNTSHVPGGLNPGDRGRIALTDINQRIKRLPTLRAMTSSIRREFSIPPKRDIPKRYRGGESILWR